MFAGDDDLLNLIQTEAITLVDSILEESVTVVNNNSSPFNPSSFAQENELLQHDEHQLSHQLSYDENIYDQQQQQFQLPLINVNNYSINLDQAHSDEISDNFAIKSDCDIIVKSPTIESMSGKSFEDVDDEFNFSGSAFSDVNVESSLNNNTATNIMTSSSSSIPPQTIVEEIVGSSDDGDDDNVHAKAQNLVDTVLQETIDKPFSKVKPTKVSFLASESVDLLGNYEASSSFPELEEIPSFPELEESPRTLHNISEHKLHRVERKFEHLSSEVREDDPELVDLDQKIDDLVDKEDISMLQNDFSKISWDDSLSATTGDLGSSTPDNDLQDVLNIPGDTFRQQHNK
jgi:hypothetical protein